MRRGASSALVMALVFASGAVHAQAQPASQPLEPLPPPDPAPAPAPLPPPPPSPSEPAGTLAPGDLGGGPEAPPLREVPLPEKPKVDLAAKMRQSTKGEIGWQYVRVHDVPITAAKVNLMFGAQNDWIAHYALLSFMIGSTEESRRAWDLRLGYMGDLLRWSVLRAGVGADAGYLVIRRVSYDDRAYAFGVGALFHVGVDLFPFGPRNDHALTIDGRFEAHIHFGNAAMWGPSILAGFRW